MNTIEKLGDEETFRQIVERSIASFEDNELTEVAGYSFYNCDKLADVSLPNATTIGEYAFEGCTNLNSLDLLKVTQINYQAFYNCKNLSAAKLPKVKNIDSNAFYGCSSMASVIVGTELEDKTAICTLGSTSSLPSSIGVIYVPYNLQGKYKTATNWSSFASKIQGYEQPVACQSLTITADDVKGYQTTTTIHWEATCTYSIEGMMQSGTMVFKGDVVSDAFGKNPSSDSSRSIEVSYTFLGQTATTTITQDKYVGDPLGGTIFYIDDTADGAYEFYDADGNVISSVAVGDAPAMYKVLTPGTKDKYYVCNTEIYPTNKSWTYYKNGVYVYTGLGTGTAIGAGKTNTATVMAADDGAYITPDSNGYSTIWYQLQQTRSATGCTDWFIPSKDEMEAVRTSGIISFGGRYIWSSSEYNNTKYAWYWDGSYWNYYGKGNNYGSVFFIRAF